MEIKMKNVELQVKVHPVNEPQGSLKGFASLSIAGLVAINGVRVIDGSKGLFVAMPQMKDQNGEYRDIAFPLTGELRKTIEEAVLTEYAQSIEQGITKEKSITQGLRNGTQKSSYQPNKSQNGIRTYGVSID
jgi:stage V sporulation protein G